MVSSDLTAARSWPIGALPPGHGPKANPSGLSNEDSWSQETAQRLLLEKRDPAAVPRLKEIAKGAVQPRELGAGPAIARCLRRARRAADVGEVCRMRQPHAASRRSSWPNRGSQKAPELVDRWPHWPATRTCAVRFQCALTLGLATIRR